MTRTLAFALVVAFTLGAGAAQAGAAQADDVAAAMEGAGKAFAAENLKETRRQLQVAVVGVNQMIVDLLIDYLPAPPPGWKADEPEGIDASSMGFGFFAGLSINKTYYPPGGTSIDVSVVANSPILASMRMLVSNPMLAQMSGQKGMKLVEMCGYDTIEEFDTESDTYGLNILAGHSTLIGISGDRASDKEHCYTLGNSMDCKGIVAVVE